MDPSPQPSSRRNSYIWSGVGIAILIVLVGAYYYESKKSATASVPATATTAKGTAPVTLTGKAVDFATLGLKCPSGNITVNSAQYASTAAGKCAGASNKAGVAALCNGKPSCSINVLPSSMKMKNGLLGSLLPTDPCPKIGKTLTVGYSCA